MIQSCLTSQISRDEVCPQASHADARDQSDLPVS